MILVVFVILSIGCSKSDDSGSTSSINDNNSSDNCQGLCITIKYKK
jgi:hypothetical protein